MSEADNKLADEEALTEKVHRIFHGEKCAYGGRLCPTRARASAIICKALSAQREALAKTPTFEQGYVLAVAEIVRTHDNIRIARDVLRGIGEVDWATIDEADIKTLTEAGLVMKAPKRRQG